MGKFIDITGQKFYRLTAIKYLGNRKWLFQCDCGRQTTVVASQVKNGNTMSCGCLHAELLRHRTIVRNTTHGKSKTSEYRTWAGIIARCLNPNDKNYKDYGGRGIKVCDRWLNSFENFLADMGSRPTIKHSVDRIDVNGDYCPENCRWATPKEQCNNKRTNIRVAYNGKIQTLMEWCDELGMSYVRVKRRWDRGVRNADCLFDPILHTTHHKVKLIDNDGNVIKLYESQTEAAKDLGICRDTVRKYCRHIGGTRLLNLEYAV